MENKEKQERAKAYTEVLEILRNMPKEDVDKIPESKLNVFKENCDKNYDYHYDDSKPFEEQTSRRTRAILGILFRDYWATPEQREAILKKQEQERMELKLKRYNSILNEHKDDN